VLALTTAFLFWPWPVGGSTFVSLGLCGLLLSDDLHVEDDASERLLALDQVCQFLDDALIPSGVLVPGVGRILALGLSKLGLGFLQGARERTIYQLGFSPCARE